MSRVFLIDTDTASDDAVALIMALRAAPAVKVAAITVVAGNVGVDQACRNALYTVELCGADVPVFRGAAKPLQREAEDASWFHGRDGLGDRGYPPPRGSVVAGKHAAEAIVETARANPGLVLVTLGPLTNVALALRLDPDLGKRLGRCVVMGGNPCCEGNVTPAAEFNIWADPEAAREVFGAGLPLELIGWHLCRGDAALLPDEIEKVLALRNPVAAFAVDCNEVARGAYLTQTGQDGISLPDPVAMSVALDPSIAVDGSEHRVQIEAESPLTRGMTVVDRLHVGQDDRNREIWSKTPVANARVVWKIDVARWKALLMRSVE